VLSLSFVFLFILRKLHQTKIQSYHNKVYAEGCKPHQDVSKVFNHRENRGLAEETKK